MNRRELFKGILGASVAAPVAAKSARVNIIDAALPEYARYKKFFVQHGSHLEISGITEVMLGGGPHITYREWRKLRGLDA